MTTLSRTPLDKTLWPGFGGLLHDAWVEFDRTRDSGTPSSTSCRFWCSSNSAGEPGDAILLAARRVSGTRAAGSRWSFPSRATTRSLGHASAGFELGGRTGDRPHMSQECRFWKPRRGRCGVARPTRTWHVECGHPKPEVSRLRSLAVICYPSRRPLQLGAGAEIRERGVADKPMSVAVS